VTDTEDSRRKLEEFLAEARRNENTLRRFQQLELRLMACESLADLLQELIYANRQAFEWDVVTLALHDPVYDYRRQLQQADVNAMTDFPDLLFVNDTHLLLLPFGRVISPLLGRYDKQVHGALFQHFTKAIASVAILPLRHQGQLLGCLNLGSFRSGRFSEDTATDFLEHLGAVIAICIDMTSVRDRLKYLGLTDALTGVNNRRFFDQRAQEEVARAQRSHQPMSCLFVDIDHFKIINDSHGHQDGDKVLARVAGVIRQQLRSIDVVARYGGEEFAILLAQTGEVRAIEVAERIRARIELLELESEAGADIRVTVSIGVATQSAGDGEDSAKLATELVRQSDAALYRAKERGRNRVICADNF